VVFVNVFIAATEREWGSTEIRKFHVHC